MSVARLHAATVHLASAHDSLVREAGEFEWEFVAVGDEELCFSFGRFPLDSSLATWGRLIEAEPPRPLNHIRRGVPRLDEFCTLLASCLALSEKLDGEGEVVRAYRTAVLQFVGSPFLFRSEIVTGPEHIASAGDDAESWVRCSVRPLVPGRSLLGMLERLTGTALVVRDLASAGARTPTETRALVRQGIDKAADFTWVRTPSAPVYRFSVQQAVIVEQLWLDWEKQGEGLSGAFLCRAAGYDQEELGRVLKGHAAWSTLIKPVQGRQGIYRLALPLATETQT